MVFRESILTVAIARKERADLVRIQPFRMGLKVVVRSFHSIRPGSNFEVTRIDDRGFLNSATLSASSHEYLTIQVQYST